MTSRRVPAPVNPRSKARVAALQALFEADLVSHPAESSLRWLGKEAGLTEESANYAMELTEGVRERRSEIDKHIQRFAPAWPVGQLPAVERNILRLALYEMHYRPDTPRKVAINEAVELAKVFGAETSPKFVNGVLGSAMDQMENERREVKGFDEGL